MNEHTDYKLKSGNILRVEQDIDANSPDAWGNHDLFLVYDHRDFTVKRSRCSPRDIWDRLDEQTGTIPDNDNDNTRFDDYYIFVVYAYIHGNVSLSLKDSSYPFNDKWDVSTTGFILCKKEQQIEEGKKPVMYTMPEARKYAEGLIETWNQYLSGDVYIFTLLKPIITYTITEKDIEELACTIGQLMNNNSEEQFFFKEQFLKIASKEIELEELDSCDEFYGDNPKENGMLDDINDELEDD